MTRPDPLVLEGLLALAWGDGGSALPWIKLKQQYGSPGEVATLCRIALAFSDCPDRETIEDILASAAGQRRPSETPKMT